MDIATLQQEAHAIASEQGWWDETTTFGDRIERIHGALSEAGKASRAPAWKGDLGWRYVPILDDETGEIISNKPVGVASELADVVIRVADMAENYGVVAEVDPRMKGYPWAVEWNKRLWDERRATWNFGDWVMDCHWSLANAAYERELKSRPWAHYLGSFLQVVYDMATHYGIDLDAAIEAKMAYMRGAAR